MLKPDLLNEVRRILFAYTKRNPVVGYVQGINFILGRLILHLNEVEAFWVFTMLLEGVLPVDYYAHLMGVHADCHYLEEELLRKVLPDVHEKFKSLSFKSTIFSFNWFCCLFQDKLSDRVSSTLLIGIALPGHLGPDLPPRQPHATQRSPRHPVQAEAPDSRGVKLW